MGWDLARAVALAGMLAILTGRMILLAGSPVGGW
jgi:hypothetical protein